MNTMIKKLGCRLVPVLLAYSTAGLGAEKPAEKPAGYPVRPIRIIIGVAAGAGADMVARTTAQILTERWGQNVVVEPRPGGGGVIASEIASRAAPDGYTLYQSGFGLLYQGAAKRVPFDVLKTFEPVVRTTQQPYILLVHPNVPVKSFKELVAHSAIKPLTYAGSSGTGSTVHLGMERLARLSGLKVKHVAYKGSAPALLALMGGEINVAATSVMSATGAIRTGKVRGLATLGLKRNEALPDLPSVAEQGFPGFSITNRYDLWAPAKTPRPMLEAIHRVVSDGMHTPQVVQRLTADGSEPAERMSRAELKTALAREYVELERSVKELNLQLR